MNVSDTAQTLATRIVWCCADVWNFWAKSEAFNFRKVSPLHELLQHVFPCYSWSKIECLRYCLNFGYQNSLMLCLCVRLLGKICDVQFLSFFFNFALRYSKRRLKLNVSDTAQTLATRIVWCCADVWNFWAKSKAFNFWKVSPLHELLLHVFPCYSWSKIECLRYCSNFGYQNSLMLCLCVRLLGKIRDVQFLSFFFNFALRNSKRRLKIECLRYSSNFAYQNSLMLCWCLKCLVRQ